MISMETHRELYLKGNAQLAVDYAKNIPCMYATCSTFHWCWRGAAPITRKHMLSINSFKATQDPASKLIIWSDRERPGLDVRIYDPIQEAKGTPLEGKMKWLTANDDKGWADGDLFRILVLYKYGGVYFDCDMVLLRDFSPLLSQEFMYQWGSEMHIQNGALMHVRKGSKFASDLMEELCKSKPRPGTTNWSYRLYKKVRKKNKDYTIFPGGFFNPEWQDAESPFEPFKKKEFKMYEGSFAWHWHNKWDEPIEKGCKFEAIEEYINAKLAKNTGK